MTEYFVSEGTPGILSVQFLFKAGLSRGSR